jgi:AcrR family transcriptional regulator
MKKNEKKERFLEVVLQLIHEKGFKATTMRDIAEKLNFDVANIYNYIDSKQSLLEIYLFNIQNEFHDSIDLILHSTHTPQEKLRLFICSYIQITAKRPFEQALIANEWRNLKNPKLQEFIDRRKDYENKLKTIINEGVRKGQFRVINVEITSDIIMSALRWQYIKYIQPKTSVDITEIEKEFSNFILSAIVKN